MLGSAGGGGRPRPPPVPAGSGGDHSVRLPICMRSTFFGGFKEKIDHISITRIRRSENSSDFSSGTVPRSIADEFCFGPLRILVSSKSTISRYSILRYETTNLRFSQKGCTYWEPDCTPLHAPRTSTTGTAHGDESGFAFRLCSGVRAEGTGQASHGTSHSWAVACGSTWTIPRNFQFLTSREDSTSFLAPRTEVELSWAVVP
eukprot:7079680-Prymnesium_polylepis.1